jgi:hypothetical protein
MSRIVDFNISTPRNRTQSSNECGVVINNTVRNHINERSVSEPVTYPSLDTVSVAPVVEKSHDDEFYTELNALRLENAINKEIALTLSRILKSNNKKLLANLLDQSGKIIVDIESLATIISKLLNVNLDTIHISYSVPTEGCLAKVTKIYDIDNIKINHIDFRLGYNEKYNVLNDDYAISLTKIIL